MSFQKFAGLPVFRGFLPAATSAGFVAMIAAVDFIERHHWRLDGLAGDEALGDEEEMLEDGSLSACQLNSSPGQESGY